MAAWVLESTPVSCALGLEGSIALATMSSTDRPYAPYAGAAVEFPTLNMVAGEVGRSEVGAAAGGAAARVYAAEGLAS